MKPKDIAKRMSRDAFHQRIIEDGIAAVKIYYGASDDNTKLKLKGCLEGFELARKESDVRKLLTLVEQQHLEMKSAFERRLDDFWIYRASELQLRWVMHCLSAYDFLTGGMPYGAPSQKAMRHTERILGLIE